MRSFNILLADGFPIYVEGLRAVLHKAEGRFHCAVKGVAQTGAEVSRMLRESATDLLLIDIGLPETDGLKILPTVKKGFANTRILVLSQLDDPRLVRAAFKAGADGYMLKSGSKDELFKAIEQVLNGDVFVGAGLTIGDRNGHSISSAGSPDVRFARQFGLTRRETEVMPFIGQALNNKEIADKLYISDQTVSVHRKNIMRKLGVNNTASLIKIAYEHNLV